LFGGFFVRIFKTREEYGLQVGGTVDRMEQKTIEPFDNLMSKKSISTLVCFQTPFNVHSGLALGSFCIITGIVLLVDAVALVATNIKKEK
jgi:hypothetical protein